MIRQSGSAYLGTALFAGLNMIDAWLTRIALSIGGEELIYYHFFKTDIWLKGLLGLLIAVVLIYLGRVKLLKWLNCGIGVAVLVNTFCIALVVLTYYFGPHAGPAPTLLQSLTRFL